jgi:hypothetical protein
MRRVYGQLAIVLLLAACAGPEEIGGADAGADADTVADAATVAVADAGADGDAGADAGCPLGAACKPIPIDAFPFTDARDTAEAPSDATDSYGCAPATGEAGGEWFYRIVLNEPAMITAALDDVPGDGVDVDLHLLDGASCLTRDNVVVGRFLAAGTYTLVADTWSSSAGAEFPGPYTLTVRRYASGPCAFDPRAIRMFWTACDGALDCRDEGGERRLQTPALGPVVMEAHLVTVDDGFAGGWPASATDGLAAHYARSEAATCFPTERNQVWAPEGEGGSHWGGGATGQYLPVVDEGWYVNMYWRDRPPRGTRMLVIDPVTGAAVVAAGGWETGPGSNTAIGGAVEEIHRWLGTSHRDRLVMGFALDANLPPGPIDCDGGPLNLCE